MEIASIVSLMLLAGLAIFQATLAAGAPAGRFAWGGQHRVLPMRLRLGSLFAIVIYGLIAALVVDKSGLWELIGSDALVQVGLWVAALYSSLGIIMNSLSRSKLERAVMTPVAAVLAFCFYALVT